MAIGNIMLSLVSYKAYKDAARQDAAALHTTGKQHSDSSSMATFTCEEKKKKRFCFLDTAAEFWKLSSIHMYPTKVMSRRSVTQV